MADDRTFVIVGASLAGRARRPSSCASDGFTGRVVLIGAETDRPYERPPLSKGYLLGKEPRDKAFVHEAQWYGEHDVELVLGVTATGAGPGRAHGHPATTSIRCATTSCCSRPGRGPAQLDVPGSDSDGIHYLRTIDESDTLRDGPARGRPGAGDRRRLDRAGDRRRRPRARRRRHRGRDGHAAAAPGAGRRGGDRTSATSTRPTASTFHFGAGRARVRRLGRPGHPRGARPTAPRCRPTWSSSASASSPTWSWPRRPGSRSATASSPTSGCAPPTPTSTRPATSPRSCTRCWASGSASSTGPTRATAGRAAASAMLGGDAPFDRVPYFFSDQYVGKPHIGMEYAGYVEPGRLRRGGVPGRPDGPARRQPQVPGLLGCARGGCWRA